MDAKQAEREAMLMALTADIPETVEQRRKTFDTSDERVRAATIRLGVFEPNLTRGQMVSRLASAGVFVHNGRYVRQDGDELTLLFPDWTEQ